MYNPEAGTGEVALTATRAAVRFTTGKLQQLRDKTITVTTPVAALSVRGTDFWAGIVDYQYGVLLLQGKLNVSNSVGAVNLLPGQGTDFAPSLKDPEGPGTPYQWPPDKVARALATHKLSGGIRPWRSRAAYTAHTNNDPRRRQAGFALIVPGKATRMRLIPIPKSRGLES